MDDIARAAEDVLLTHPHPALRLGELLELLDEGILRGLTAARLRTVLEAHPETFRILDAWQRRWLAPPGSSTAGTRVEPWIVCVSDRPRPPHGPPAAGAAGRLRQSVRWLGRTTDPRSRLEVGRWYAMALSEREARRVVARQAARAAPPEAEREAS
jgi:hypothetical protein